MEDKLTIVALEVDIDSPNLKVEYSFSLFDIECTTTTVIEVEEASSNLEVGFTFPVLEIKKTSFNIYNVIYRLCERYKDKKPDSGLFLEALFEKIVHNSDWKVYVRNLGSERHLAANALVEDEMASTYAWILRCLMKATTFYSCRNVLSIELFEQHWKSMIKTFPECHDYMTRTLYANRLSWAKSYVPTSTLCNVEKVIEKRLEDESQYNKLVDLKAPNILIRLPHLSLQFFTNIDAILVQFLTPLILLWQRFQICQSLTYEGCLVSFSVEILEIDTVNNAFIEDINDKPQITLKSLLNSVEVSKTVTKGIICHHFWRVMLYSSHAKFHISIIPARWYKNNIVDQLDAYLDNSPKLEHHNVICHATPLRNWFGIAFSVSKTAINIALETNSDEELIRMLKNFITVKQQTYEVVPLQQQLISQITEPKIVKIRGAPSKKKMKSFTEEMGKKVNVQESNHGKTSSQAQRKCLLCGAPGHYQKKCL
ncbi:18499_t:CDS:2, partial [Gigaspora margarita]